MLPVVLDLRGRACLVVGGGEVARRKAEELLSEGALVTVVAPDVEPPLEALAACGKLTLERRRYRAGEAGGYRLLFAATDEPETNRQAAADAEAARIWANVADDPGSCSFHIPARVKRGPLQIAVASQGVAPFAVRRLRQLLERRFPSGWSDWMAAAGRFRARVRGRGLGGAEREALFDRFFSATVDPETFSARVPLPEEEEEWLEGQGPDRHTAKAGISERVGFVSLVGAGPGDPGLLTMLGRRRLMAADAVVVDRLAEAAVPPDLPARVALIRVGKESGHHPVPQADIEALLISLAREGKRVVRLKGGDPCVFGRGGEEAEALRGAGIPFEVVPGVTSGTAVPIYAGIPVTYRDEAVRVTLVTAHECSKQDGQQVQWELLARDPHATLVGFMGVAALTHVSERLLAAGMDPLTPAAVIERGTTSAQRVVCAPLRDLPSTAKAEAIKPPALFVIGPVVRHAERLDWFARRPLSGQRLAVASPADGLLAPLELAGASIVEVPLPLTPAARMVLEALPLTGCLMRNAIEVEAFSAERAAFGDRAVAYCLSGEARRRAGELGWREVSAVSEGASVDELVEVLQRKRGGVTQLASLRSRA